MASRNAALSVAWGVSGAGAGAGTGASRGTEADFFDGTSIALLPLAALAISMAAQRASSSALSSFTRLKRLAIFVGSFFAGIFEGMA